MTPNAVIIERELGGAVGDFLDAPTTFEEIPYLLGDDAPKATVQRGDVTGFEGTADTRQYRPLVL